MHGLLLRATPATLRCELLARSHRAHSEESRVQRVECRSLAREESIGERNVPAVVEKSMNSEQLSK